MLCPWTWLLSLQQEDLRPMMGCQLEKFKISILTSPLPPSVMAVETSRTLRR